MGNPDAGTAAGSRDYAVRFQRRTWDFLTGSWSVAPGCDAAGFQPGDLAEYFPKEKGRPPSPALEVLRIAAWATAHDRFFVQITRPGVLHLGQVVCRQP
jgi:hypothetical protein